MNEYIVSRAFFGKSTAFKLYLDANRDLFFRVGRKADDGSWNWEIAKMNDMECGSILLFLEGGVDCKFFHQFEKKDGSKTETQIYLNRKDKDIFISINKYNKALVPAEQVVLRELLRCVIWEMNKPRLGLTSP